MARYLIFAPADTDPTDPDIGALVEVPGCFRPTDEFAAAAAARELALFFMETDQAVPQFLLDMGKRIIDQISEDPRLVARSN